MQVGRRRADGSGEGRFRGEIFVEAGLESQPCAQLVVERRSGRQSGNGLPAHFEAGENIAEDPPRRRDFPMGSPLEVEEVKSALIVAGSVGQNGVDSLAGKVICSTKSGPHESKKALEVEEKSVDPIGNQMLLQTEAERLARGERRSFRLDPGEVAEVDVRPAIAPPFGDGNSRTVELENRLDGQLSVCRVVPGDLRRIRAHSMPDLVRTIRGGGNEKMVREFGEESGSRDLAGYKCLGEEVDSLPDRIRVGSIGRDVRGDLRRGDHQFLGEQRTELPPAWNWEEPLQRHEPGARQEIRQFPTRREHWAVGGDRAAEWRKKPAGSRFGAA